MSLTATNKITAAALTVQGHIILEYFEHSTLKFVVHYLRNLCEVKFNYNPMTVSDERFQDKHVYVACRPVSSPVPGFTGNMKYCLIFIYERII